MEKKLIFPPSNTIGPEEKAAVNRVMDSGILSNFVGRAGQYFLGGTEVLAFEQAVAKKINVKYAVSFNSATTALEAAVAALVLPPGSEIIVPPYTMTASVMSIVVNNLVPVFADIVPGNFCLDPESVEACITAKTRAIMAVNLFGGSPDYNRLLEIAKKYNLKIIEDNAQGAGGTFQGKNLGTIGDMGVFSFNFHKTIQAGEGGVLVTNDKDLAYRAQLKRNHGENVTDDLGEHDLPIAGSNFRLTELHAAISTEQLKKLDFLNEQRIVLADYLTEQLTVANIPGIAPCRKRDGDVHVYYMYSIVFDAVKFGISRSDFVKAMQTAGLPMTAGYVKPIYLLNFFQDKNTVDFWPQLANGKYAKGLCPVTEDYFSNTLVSTTICRYPLTREHIDVFVAEIKKLQEAT